ncbi:MAG: hypothetical protein AAF492_10210 [Verrucomicrobiota bacterium]
MKPAPPRNDFERRQAEVYDEITRKLTGLIPAHWNSAQLDMRAAGDDLALSIFNFDGEVEVVEPSLELFEAGMKLVRLYEGTNCEWSRAEYAVSRETGSEAWREHVKFRYV